MLRSWLGCSCKTSSDASSWQLCFSTDCDCTRASLIAFTHLSHPRLGRCMPCDTGALEAELIQRAQLQHTQFLLRSVSQAASSTATNVRRLRAGLQVTQLVSMAIGAGGALRQRLNAAAASNLATRSSQA